MSFSSQTFFSVYQPVYSYSITSQCCKSINLQKRRSNTQRHDEKRTHAHIHTPLPIRDSSSNKSTPQGRAHISSEGGDKVEAPRTCRFLSLPGFQRARRTLFTGHQVSLGSLWTGGSWLAFRARLVKLI